MLRFLKKLGDLVVHGKAVKSEHLDRGGLDVLRRQGRVSGPQNTAFYFYFPRVDAADRVADQLRREQFAVTVRHSAVGDSWLVLAAKPMDPETEIEALRPGFEALAKAEGGEYDGWEVEIRER